MSRRFDHLGDVETFIAVIEHGSLTAAAVALATTPSVISRAIVRLENRLGTQLLRRTTRRQGLTDAGRVYLEHARSAFALIDDAERAIQDQNGELSGRVRLSVPTPYGHYRLPAMLQRYAPRYPRVSIALNIANRNVDLVAEGYDLGLRTGEFTDGRVRSVKVGDRSARTCAAPDYLRSAGRPTSIADLERHRCLLGSAPTWHFKVEGQDKILRPRPGWRCNSGASVVAAALAGRGICHLPEVYVAEHLSRGSLEAVLEDYCPDPEPIWAVHPHRRHLPPKISRLITMLEEELPSAIR